MSPQALIDAAPVPVAPPRLVPVFRFLLAGLDGFANGIALFDEHSHLVYANAAARTFLSLADWENVGGAVRSPKLDERSAWGAALGQACRFGRHQLVDLTSPEGTVFAAVVPVAVDGQHLAFVTFGRHDLCGSLELQLFASRFGLTGAENQVLGKLSTGLRPAEIADAHGVAVSTVLTQVASIRAKTVTSSIKQLLCMLSRMPPLRQVFVRAPMR
jgi:DNA-binding CsgD family transcriptional regulator